MRVDTALALRVLAHELRSPAGVAQGYIRMLLEGRLPDGDGQRRALEQIRDVLGRIGQLSGQASETAAWLERLDGTGVQHVAARALVDDALAEAQQSHTLETTCEAAVETASLGTTDRRALAAAIGAFVGATARERPGQPTRVRVGTTSSPALLEILAGSGEGVLALAAGPLDPGATPLVVERGGLGLALVTAALVLDSHGATTWSIDGQRGACGIRLPLST
ncbi:MAG: hypothetical protein ABR606_09285 [Vicinamibacterales bacterium]